MTLTLDTRIIETIKLASKYPTIKRVGVFGSFIKGNAHSGSDLDLVYDRDDTKEESIDELLDYVEEINDVLLNCAQVAKIDYVWFKGALESNNSKFRETMLNEVVWIYESSY